MCWYQEHTEKQFSVGPDSTTKQKEKFVSIHILISLLQAAAYFLSVDLPPETFYFFHSFVIFLTWLDIFQISQGPFAVCLCPWIPPLDTLALEHIL